MKKSYLVDKISSSVNLDALPYLDKELEAPGMQDLVDKMIADEMRTFKPRNYLADLPIPDYDFSDDPLLMNEYKRVQNKEPMKKLDYSYYEISPPSDNNTDLEAWKKPIELTQIQYEQQRTKHMNLQLLQTFGKNVYRRHNDELESMLNIYTEKNNKVLEDIEQINRKRKSEQEINGDKLRKLEKEYNELVLGNYQIEAACRALEENRKEKEENQNA